MIDKILKEIEKIKKNNQEDLIKRIELTYDLIKKYVNKDKYNIEELYIKRNGFDLLNYLKLYDKNNNKLVYSIEYYNFLHTMLKIESFKEQNFRLYISENEISISNDRFKIYQTGRSKNEKNDKIMLIKKKIEKDIF